VSAYEVRGMCDGHRMKAYLDTSVNMKSADYDETELIFDKNMYRTREQVVCHAERIILTLFSAVPVLPI